MRPSLALNPDLRRTLYTLATAKLFRLFCNFACFCSSVCCIVSRFSSFFKFFDVHIISAVFRYVNNFFCFFEKFNFYTNFSTASILQILSRFSRAQPPALFFIFKDICTTYVINSIYNRQNMPRFPVFFLVCAHLSQPSVDTILMRISVDFMQKPSIFV